ncbi:hypothetical protein [Streptomyces abikoensis]|uniref:hypothetical protein n=1 Tax=Streptomyces abikoensis TaxID=97398 RepID=UPI0016740495|nr:hypothetical protein [Streptomyces abikoensis]GGP76005.1 hypothetical protein GCM10010214_59250 [Streptomyces abikoensis]
MDLTDLTDAYQRLVKAAEGITDASPITDAERADVAWLLAHIALSDRVLTTAARELLGGATSVVVDNQPAMDTRAIDDLIAGTTHLQRIEVLHRNAVELMDLLDLMPKSAWSADVELRIHDRDGRHVSDSQLTWSGLIDIRAKQNIPGHAVRLAELGNRG